MQKFIYKIFASIFVCCAFIATCLAQDNCAGALKRAEQLFDVGKIEEVYSLITPCLESGFSKDQKIKAYELLIQSLLIDGNEQLAEDYMKDLLLINPYYDINSNILTSEYVNLFNTFRVRQIFSAGLFFGFGLPQIKLSEQYGVHNLNEVSGKYYSRFGYNFGLVALTGLGSKIDLEFNFRYSRDYFEYKLNNLYNIADISYTENMSTFNFSLGAIYKIKIRKCEPYLYLGSGYRYLYEAMREPQRHYLSNMISDLSSSANSTIDNYKKNTACGIAGLGLRYYLSNGYFWGDVRYYRAFGILNKASSRYDNETMIYKYFVVEDDIYKNDWYFSLGYSFIFIKPIKKKSL